MFADLHLARVKQAFAEQFTPDGPGFVYRQGRRGPAIRVSAAERDGFVAAFDRGIVRLGWGVVLASAALLAALEIRPIALPEPWQGHREELAVALLLIAFMASWWWIRNAPTRALERRAAIDQGISGAAFRRRALIALPWSFPGTAALFMVALVVRVAVEPDPLAPGNWSYYAIAAIGLAGMAVIAWLKGRARR